MKILSGDYKGLSIITKKRTNYRPTQSRIRKSIFDILKPFSYLNVLDLFSGTGIIGFEAASRGAESVTFIDSDIRSIRLLKLNQNKFDNTNFITIKNNALSFLKKIDKKYDLIFADPPYECLDYSVLMKECVQRLSENGKLVIEMSKNNFSYKDATEKLYGNTKIIIYTKK